MVVGSLAMLCWVTCFAHSESTVCPVGPTIVLRSSSRLVTQSDLPSRWLCHARVLRHGGCRVTARASDSGSGDAGPASVTFLSHLSFSFLAGTNDKFEPRAAVINGSDRSPASEFYRSRARPCLSQRPPPSMPVGLVRPSTKSSVTTFDRLLTRFAKHASKPFRSPTATTGLPIE